MTKKELKVEQEEHSLITVSSELKESLRKKHGDKLRSITEVSHFSIVSKIKKKV